MRGLSVTGAALAAALLAGASASQAADPAPAPPAQFNGRWAAPGARCFGRGVDVIEVGVDHVAMPAGSGPITAVKVVSDREVEITLRTSPGGGAAVVTRPVRLALSPDGASLTEAGSGVTRTRCDAPSTRAAAAPQAPRVDASTPPATAPAKPGAEADPALSPYADIGACMWREIGEGARKKVRDVLGVRVRLDEVVETYHRQGTFDVAVGKCDPAYAEHKSFTDALLGAHAIRVVALDYFEELGIGEADLVAALRASPMVRRSLWTWMRAAFDEDAREVADVDYGEATRRLGLNAEAADVAGTFYQFDALENYILYDEISPPGGPITPVWLKRPNAADIRAAYPPGAGRLRDEARVVMNCPILAEGRFGPCEVESESPAGQGFGRAAQDLARLYRLDPWSREGEPVEGSSIRVTIAFGDP